MAAKMETKSKISVQPKTGFLKGVRSELKKIVWPTRRELINYSVTVIVISVVVAALVWGMDTIIRRILSLFIG